MKLLNNPTIAHQVIELLKKEYEMEKPLPHLAELVYCLTRSYYDRMEPLPPTEREILLFAVGLGLERLLLKGQRLAVVGQCEGIHYSPDFIALTDLPGELKTTRSSSSKFGESFFPETWKRQILGYMRCLEVTEYELVVLFLMGNWKPPFPDLVSYRVVADEAEILENWRWLQERKQIYLAAIESGIAPPVKIFAEDWECKECRYHLRCANAIGVEKFNAMLRGKEVI